ncbi:sensor histidine kinase, partial [Planococcus sp. SIMBA_143]
VKSLEIFSLFLKGKYKTTDLLIPISEELTYTNYYIEIQKMRFRSRLSVSITSSEDLHNAHIPPFVIQTLVENSFKHGLEKKAG